MADEHDLFARAGVSYACGIHLLRFFSSWFHDSSSATFTVINILSSPVKSRDVQGIAGISQSIARGVAKSGDDLCLTLTVVLYV